MSIRLVALGASLIVCAASADCRTITFKSGILSGLTAEIPDSGKQPAGGYFTPGVTNAVSTTPERVKQIAVTLLESKSRFEHETPQQQFTGYLGKRAPGESWDHFGGRLQSQCKVEPPVHLSDDRERVGVDCGDRIAQFFVVSFEGNSISKFQIDEAIVPDLLAEGR